MRNMLVRWAVVVLIVAVCGVLAASPSQAADHLLIGRYSTPEMADPYIPAAVLDAAVAPVVAPAPVTPEPAVAPAPIAPEPQRSVPAPAVVAPEAVAPGPAAPVAEVPVADLHDDAAAPDAAQAGPGGSEVPTGVVQTPIAEDFPPTVTP